MESPPEVHAKPRLQQQRLQVIFGSRVNYERRLRPCPVKTAVFAAVQRGEGRRGGGTGERGGRAIAAVLMAWRGVREGARG